jgi:hypothetical protein
MASSLNMSRDSGEYLTPQPAQEIFSEERKISNRQARSLPFY